MTRGGLGVQIPSRNFKEFRKILLPNIIIQFKFNIINTCQGYLYNPKSIYIVL
jgi:hypothetical protein